jgi:hypothetical protein
MRPRRMLATTVAIGILNLTAFVNLKWTHRSAVAAAFLVVLVSYTVLWFFWNGRNWARLVVLFISVVALLDLFTLFHPPGNVLLYDAAVIAWAILGLFLIYWLNRADVRGWFKHPKTPSVVV